MAKRSKKKNRQPARSETRPELATQDAARVEHAEAPLTRVEEALAPLTHEDHEDPGSGPRLITRPTPIDASRDEQEQRDDDPVLDIGESELDEPIDEKRQEPLVSLVVDIDFASDSHFFAGLSGELSEGGVFIETYRELPVGSGVALELTLPNGTVRALGSVRWHRTASDSSSPGLGIAFEALSEGDKEFVDAFCEARAPLYYELDLAS